MTTDERLADEVAILDRLEERLVARFTRFLLINAAALVGMMTTGIAGYYSLDKRISYAETRISINDSRIERLLSENASLRLVCDQNQRDLNTQLNGIRQMFYEHDSNLNRRNR